MIAHFISLLAPLVLVAVSAKGHPSWSPDSQWVDSWVSMPQLVEPANLPPVPYNGTDAIFFNSTIRQTVHLSLPSTSLLRLRISNAFGVNNLQITSVTIALPVDNKAGVSAIQLSTLKGVTFSGSTSYTIPSGALVVSDPIDLHVRGQSMVSVSIFLEDGQAGSSITGHPGSRTTSWIGKGNQASKQNLTDSTRASIAHWYFLSSIEVLTSRDSSAFVIVGDSITDGRGSTTDKNDRWPDLLLARMQTTASTSKIAVLNQAAGGNRILNDGLGPNTLSRIDRDVLSHSGLGYVMIYEGVNDIGTAPVDAVSQKIVGDRLIEALMQISIRVQAKNLPIFAATITPFSAPEYNTTIQSYSDPERERTRQRVNNWIRNSGVFDEVVDFDLVLRNQSHPEQLSSAFNGGDWLHPNVAGYQEVANRFPLDIF